MDKRNETWVNEFILLGFSYPPHIKILLFVMLLAALLVNLIANSLFITVVLSYTQLHSPMYFFLCNLSFLDICYSSVGGPTAFSGIFVGRITISYYECITQMYVSLSLGQTECFLLAVMAWDRFVAISSPLNYQQIVTNRVCIILAIATWATGFILALSSFIILKVAYFCRSNIIDHVVCEAEAISRIICLDNILYKYATSLLSLLFLVLPVCFILFTYCRILTTILRLPNRESRHRTFATCGSHLTVVIIFYGTAMISYLGPKSAEMTEKEKSISLFYGLVVPALNPLIYTLRNKEVKGAMKKLYIRNSTCQRPRS